MTAGVPEPDADGRRRFFAETVPEMLDVTRSLVDEAGAAFGLLWAHRDPQPPGAGGFHFHDHGDPPAGVPVLWLAVAFLPEHDPADCPTTDIHSAQHNAVGCTPSDGTPAGHDYARKQACVELLRILGANITTLEMP